MYNGSIFFFTFISQPWHVEILILATFCYHSNGILFSAWAWRDCQRRTAWICLVLAYADHTDSSPFPTKKKLKNKINMERQQLLLDYKHSLYLDGNKSFSFLPAVPETIHCVCWHLIYFCMHLTGHHTYFLLHFLMMLCCCSQKPTCSLPWHLQTTFDLATSIQFL